MNSNPLFEPLLGWRSINELPYILSKDESRESNPVAVLTDPLYKLFCLLCDFSDGFLTVRYKTRRGTDTIPITYTIDP